MKLEYKYLIGFSGIFVDKRGDIFSVDIDSKKIRIQEFNTTVSTTDISKYTILHIEMDDRLHIEYKRWDGTHIHIINHNVINNRIKSYHLYNRRKSIIEGI